MNHRLTSVYLACRASLEAGSQDRSASLAKA